MVTRNSVSPRRRPTWAERSKRRNDARDAVMRMVFAKRGLAIEIADRLGLTPQGVSSWKRVPAHHAMEVARILDMTPEQIRPDIFKPRRK